MVSFAMEVFYSFSTMKRKLPTVMRGVSSIDSDEHFIVTTGW